MLLSKLFWIPLFCSLTLGAPQQNEEEQEENPHPYAELTREELIESLGWDEAEVDLNLARENGQSGRGEVMPVARYNESDYIADEFDADSDSFLQKEVENTDDEVNQAIAVSRLDGRNRVIEDELLDRAIHESLVSEKRGAEKAYKRVIKKTDAKQTEKQLIEFVKKKTEKDYKQEQQQLELMKNAYKETFKPVARRDKNSMLAALKNFKKLADDSKVRVLKSFYEWLLTDDRQCRANAEVEEHVLRLLEEAEKHPDLESVANEDLAQLPECSRQAVRMALELKEWTKNANNEQFPVGLNAEQMHALFLLKCAEIMQLFKKPFATFYIEQLEESKMVEMAFEEWKKSTELFLPGLSVREIYVLNHWKLAALDHTLFGAVAHEDLEELPENSKLRVKKAYNTWASNGAAVAEFKAKHRQVLKPSTEEKRTMERDRAESSRTAEDRIETSRTAQNGTGGKWIARDDTEGSRTTMNHSERSRTTEECAESSQAGGMRTINSPTTWNGAESRRTTRNRAETSGHTTEYREKITPSVEIRTNASSDRIQTSSNWSQSVPSTNNESSLLVNSDERNLRMECLQAAENRAREPSIKNQSNKIFPTGEEFVKCKKPQNSMKNNDYERNESEKKLDRIKNAERQFNWDQDAKNYYGQTKSVRRSKSRNKGQNNDDATSSPIGAHKGSKVSNAVPQSPSESESGHLYETAKMLSTVDLNSLTEEQLEERLEKLKEIKRAAVPERMRKAIGSVMTQNRVLRNFQIGTSSNNKNKQTSHKLDMRKQFDEDKSESSE